MLTSGLLCFGDLRLRLATVKQLHILGARLQLAAYSRAMTYAGNKVTALWNMHDAFLTTQLLVGDHTAQRPELM